MKRNRLLSQTTSVVLDKLVFFSYDEQGGTRVPMSDFQNRSGKKWLNIVGGKDGTLYTQLNKYYPLNTLLENDLKMCGLRPKVQDFDTQLEIVVQFPSYDEKTHHATLEQVILILGQDILITIQQSERNLFEYLEKELLSTTTKLHRGGVDYLLSIILDYVVDQYFVVSEQLTQKLDTLEDSIIQNPSKQSIESLYQYKKEIMQLVHSVWPLREVISVLEREKSDLVAENTYFYFRNILENVFQVIDTITFMRDLSTEMMDVYLSSINNKINDVMKLLTVITTVFMPLSFIASYYGMNFRYMPELDWGYPAVGVMMLLVFLGMIIFFRKKKWL